MAESSSSRITNLYEKLAIGALTLLLGWGQIQYQTDRSEAKSEIKELNIKVLELYRTSVSKAELKDLEDRLTANISGIRSDIRGILGLYVEEGVRRRTSSDK